MKNKFLSLIVLSTILIFPQEKNPNVELPDFVILGRDVVSVRKVEKQSPNFIPIISNEFIKPSYKPEQLNVVDVSNPVESDLSLLDSTNFRKGFIEVGAGRYQLPAAEISYAFPFTRGIIHGGVKGFNQTKYIDNSERTLLEGSLDFAYTLPTDLEALPGTKFSLNGNHTKNDFKFFGSIDPTRKRNLNIGHASAGVQNLYMKDFIFDLNGGGDFTYLDNEKFNEAVYYGNGFARIKLNNFGLGIKAAYKNQNLTTDSISNYNSDFFFIRPTASLKIFNKIFLEAGLTYSESGSAKLTALYASAGAEISKNLVLLAEYSPEAEYLTNGKFMQMNFYYDQNNLTRIFFKKKNKIKAILKYEYGTYYQIDGGMEYFSTDYMPYFINHSQSGFFNIAQTDAKSFNLFLDLIYHPGPFGYLYARFDYFDLRNSDSKKIPYSPDFKADLTYGYNFTNELNGEVKLYYFSDRYADLENTGERKLPGFFNIGANVTYTFERNFGVFFELMNILNVKKPIWEGYQEKPIDVVLGIRYLFE